MNQRFRKILSLILCLLMTFSLFPVSAFADAELEESACETMELSTEPEPFYEPEPETAETPVEEPVADTTEEPAEEPMEAFTEEPAGEPAEEPSEEPAGETSAEPEAEEVVVTVFFLRTPEGLSLRVYPKPTEETPEPEEILPEEDGSYRLLPGDYVFDAEAEGYGALTQEEFTVEASEAPAYITVALSPLEAEEEPTEEPGEQPAESPAEEPLDEPAEAEAVPVYFVCTPEDLSLTVWPVLDEYAAIDAGLTLIVEPIAPREDGSFLLVPGDYAYDAEAEGYVAMKGVPFTVEAGAEPLSMIVSLPSEEELPEAVPEEFYFEVQLDKSSDEMFSEYVETMFDSIRPGAQPQDARKNNGNKLSGNERVLYNAFVPFAREVANGNRTSTVVSVSTSSLSKTTFTASSLGLSSFGSSLSSSAKRAIVDAFITDRLWAAITADCPFELYWWDKGISMSWRGYISSDGSTYTFTDSISFYFGVAEEYSAGENTIKTSTITTVKKAASNAAAIVSKYAGYQDYQKLKAYNDEIQSLSDYNDPAATSSWPYEYGNAWQLIWVFDGDPSTTVVCEGFARAFQYLCDMSTFNGNVVCYTVNGTAYFSSNSGGHRWNMVTMPDGKNYLVDVTNNDSYDSLFLKGYAYGNSSSGYTYNFKTGGTARFVFTGSLSPIYSTAELTPSSTDYGYGYLDLNGMLGGSSSGSLGSMGTADIYINGTRVASGVNDYFVQWPTGSRYEIKNIQAKYGYQYNGVYSGSLTGTLGSGTTSVVLSFSALTPTSITRQPSSVTVRSGNTASFSIAAAGSGLSYQWYYRTSSAGQWAAVTASSGKTANLSVTTSPSYDGYQYRCVVTGKMGTATSNTVTLNVLYAPVITAQPQSVTVKAGDTVSFDVVAKGGSLSYQWYMRASSSAAWGAVSSSSGKTATLTVTATAGNNGYQYRCVITNSAGSTTSASAELSLVTGFLKENGKWYYYNASGAKVKNAWVADGGKYYYMGADGVMQSGGWLQVGSYWYYLNTDCSRKQYEWLQSSGKWYWFDANGRMASKAWKAIDGKYYYFTESGAMQTGGWLQLGSYWYYLNSNGSRRQNEWLQLSGKWYWFDGNGRMASAAWKTIDGKSYYFTESGAMKSGGWLQLGSYWYYLNSDGSRRQSEWLQSSGKWYWFDANGRMVSSTWATIDGKSYYFTESGAMKTGGWLQLGSNWYYLNSDGSRRQSEWYKDGSGNWYYLNASGVMLKSTSQTISGKVYRFNASGVCTNP